VEKKINIRLRLIIIKNGKLLVQYRQKQNFYHYVGGHLEYGETVKEGCIREMAEEGNGASFEFKKILYIRDFILPEENEHSLELFILGEIDKFEELEHHFDPQHLDKTVWTTWLEINNLPYNLLPNKLSKKLVNDFENNFPNRGEYVGEVG
jgi:ADP-ribose pyrophosphatase YjhB (NUDIX family)